MKCISARYACADVPSSLQLQLQVVDIMIQSSKDDPVPNQGVITNVYAALILEAASGIDEYIFSDVNYPDPKGSKLAVKEYRGSSD